MEWFLSFLTSESVAKILNNSLQHAMKCQHFILLRLVFGNVTMLTLCLPYVFHSDSIPYSVVDTVDMDIYLLSVSSLKFYSFNILILVFDIVDIPSPSFCAFRYSKTLHFVVWIQHLTLWIILPLLSVSSLNFCSVVFSIWHCGAVRSRLQGERRRAGHPDPSRPGESVRLDRRGICDLILLIVTKLWLPDEHIHFKNALIS